MRIKLTPSDVKLVVAAIQKVQPGYFQHITLNFNPNARPYSMFCNCVASEAEVVVETGTATQLGVAAIARAIEKLQPTFHHHVTCNFTGSEEVFSQFVQAVAAQLPSDMFSD